MKLLILGNGFDISLGKKTKLSDYIHYLNDLIKQSKETKGKSKLLTKEKFSYIDKFIRAYDFWCKKNKKEEYEKWSCLEINLKHFFTDAFEKEKIKGIDFKNIKEGYIYFCFLMQKYYFYQLEKKTSQIKASNEKIEKILGYINNNNVEVLSLNYTNFRNYLYQKNSSNFNLNESKINYLHLITPGISMWELIEKKEKKETNDFEFINISNMNYFWGEVDLLHDKFDKSREQTSNPIVIKKYIPNFKKNKEKEEIIDRLDSLSICNNNACIKDSDIQSIKKFINQRYITEAKSGHKYIQLLILGNDSKSIIKELSFLSKNNNEFLILKDYPKTILKRIEKKFVTKNNELLFFGYSFGEADVNINEFIKKLINEEKVLKIKILFFKNDKNLEKLKEEAKNNFNNRFIDEIKKVSLEIEEI